MSYSPGELKAWRICWKKKIPMLHLHSEPMTKTTESKVRPVCLVEKSLVSSANRSGFNLLTCEAKLKTGVDLNILAWLAPPPSLPPHLSLLSSDPLPPCCRCELSDSSGSTTNSSQPPELWHPACFISYPLNWVVKTCKNNDMIGRSRVPFFFFKLPSPPTLSLSLSHESQVGCLSIHLNAATR